MFVAAVHENRNDSRTFQLIRSSFAAFKFDTVIAEGFPTAWGNNPQRIFDYAAKTGALVDGFVEGGETIPTVSGAKQQDARLIGGEPSDTDIKARVSSEGVTAEDLLGFYVLRNIPQWIGERKIEGAGDHRLRPLVEAALERNRQSLAIASSVLPTYDRWADWYFAINRKAIGSGFNPEETGPLTDGRYGSNRIAAAVSRARDSHLHELIVARLNAGESVLVVYGASHLMIQRPALDATLGPPCYVGSDLIAATRACR